MKRYAGEMQKRQEQISKEFIQVFTLESYREAMVNSIVKWHEKEILSVLNTVIQEYENAVHKIHIIFSQHLEDTKKQLVIVARERKMFGSYAGEIVDVAKNRILCEGLDLELENTLRNISMTMQGK